MPTYEYMCDDCGHRFEVRQSFHDDPLDTCPSCARTGAVRRVLTPVGIIFKGKGFYVTDSGRKRSGKPARTSGSGKGEPADGGGGDTGGAGAAEGTKKDAEGGGDKPAESAKGAGGESGSAKGAADGSSDGA